MLERLTSDHIYIGVYNSTLVYSLCDCVYRGKPHIIHWSLSSYWIECGQLFIKTIRSFKVHKMFLLDFVITYVLLGLGTQLQILTSVCFHKYLPTCTVCVWFLREM